MIASLQPPCAGCAPTSPTRSPRRVIAASALMLCAALTGCTVGPNYHRPAVPLPPAFPNAASSAPQPGGSLGDQQWWHVFNDPTLDELIRKALAHNPSITEAAGRVEAVRAQIEALRVSYSPEVDAVANETLQRISPIGLPRNRTSGAPSGSATILGAQASWEIDFWGKYRRANEAGRAALLAGQDAQQAVLATLVSDVASAYFDLLSLDEQQRLAGKIVALRQSQLDLIVARERQGVSSLEEVRHAEAQLEHARIPLPSLARRIAEREDEIRALDGQTSGSIPRGRTLWAEELPGLGPGIPSSLLTRRPDIRQAEQALIAANANIGVAESAHFPNVSLTAAGGLESTAFHHLFTGNAATWLLQPQVNVPIFTFGRIRAGVNQAKAQGKILLGNYRGTVISAFRDVADALAFRQSAQQLEAEQQRIVAGNADAAALVHRRLDQGVSSAFDALGADSVTLSAQVSYATYRGDELVSLVHLYRALGGGWQP